MGWLGLAWVGIGLLLPSVKGALVADGMAEVETRNLALGIKSLAIYT